MIEWTATQQKPDGMLTNGQSGTAILVFVTLHFYRQVVP